jgi:hypothetical protein
VDDPGRSPRTRWTPRARAIAVTTFILVGGISAFVAALMGAVCDEPSLDCLRDEGRNVVRIAVVSVPFIAYAAYRITRGRGPH